MPPRPGLAGVVQALPFLVFLAVYLPVVGHGFVQDDYRWIVQSAAAGWTDLLRAFTVDNGFYRPVVTLSFAINQWMFDTHALGYGLTNIVLALACAAAIVSLARALGLRSGTAMFAAAIWLLNFHGMRMAVQWISGRTALLLTLGAVMAAAAMMRGRYARALAWFAVALFSKEEATVLPLLWLVWLGISGRLRSDARAAWTFVASAFAVEAIYFWMRAHTGAMLPGTAPDFYRFTFSPAVVFQNAWSYLDRGATTAALAAAIAAIALAARPALDRDHRRIAWLGLAWFAAGFALTIFLPVRSELYACMPAVGAVLVAGVAAESMWIRRSAPAHRRALIAAVATLIVVGPVLASRTDRWHALADLSETVLVDLLRETAALADDNVVVLADSREQRANIDAAFGTLLPVAYEWRARRRLRLWVEPPLTNVATSGLQPPCDACPATRLTLRQGRLVR